MKKYLAVITIFFITVSFTKDESINRPFEERVFLLSYLRSARNWLLYSLYHIAPNYDVCHQNQLLIQYGYESKPDAKKAIFPYHFTDNLTRFPNFPNKTDRIIFLLRNYRECFMRNFKDDVELTCEELAKKESIYYSLLEYYDSYPDDKKILIHYEDLILHPRETFTKIVDFLNEDHAPLEDFLNSFQEHKERSIRAYDKKHPYGSSSKGVDVLFHTKKIPLQVIQEIDELIRNDHPKLWNKYLSKYVYQPEAF